MTFDRCYILHMRHMTYDKKKNFPVKQIYFQNYDIFFMYRMKIYSFSKIWYVLEVKYFGTHLINETVDTLARKRF